MGYVTPPYTVNVDSVFLFHLWGGVEHLLKREVTPIAFSAAKRKSIECVRKVIFSSGARFGNGLERDALGRVTGRTTGGKQGR
jgi:hypothetical protein